MIQSAKSMGMTPKEANRSANQILSGAMRTLIDFGYDTKGLIHRGFSKADVRKEVVNLVNNKFGLVEDLMKEFQEPEPEEKINPNDDPKNFKMHYQWSGRY